MNKKFTFLMLFVAGALVISGLGKLFLLSPSATPTSKTGSTALSSDNENNQPNDAIIFKPFDVIIDGRNVKISAFVVNTEKLVTGIGIITPEVLSRGQNNLYTGLTLKEYADLGGFKIVQSGGFLSSWTPPYPLGYVKVRGEVYNGIHNSWVTQGVFCTDGRKFTIEAFKNEDQFKTWLSCLQAGPIILQDGKNVVDHSNNSWPITGDRHRQSFLCKNRKNQLVMGLAENVSLRKLVKFLSSEENEPGLNCKDAVLLTSKGISGIYTRTEKEPLSIGNTEVPLPNAIIIK